MNEESYISDVSDDRHGSYSGSSESSSGSEEEEFGVANDDKRSMSLYCEICDTTSSSVQHLQMHFAGSKHKRKLEMAGLSTKLTDYVERPKNLDIWKMVVRCILCKVMMVGSDCLIHSKSPEHQRKLSKMSQRNQDFYTDISNCFKTVEVDEEEVEKSTDNSLVCGICELELSGKEHLELHLSGKKHQRKAHWLRISDKEVNAREYKQVWCSLCRVFVNSLESFEGHIRGKQHIKTLKRAGVKWKVLADSYGEATVGFEVPIKRHLKDPKKSVLHHTHSKDGHSSMADRRHPSPSASSESKHTPRSPKRERSCSPLAKKACSSVNLPVPSWACEYASLPEYDPALPHLLRESRPRTEHRVIHQKPLLAVGYCLQDMDLDDSRLSELEQRTRSATLEREAREREERRREREEQGRDRERQWRDRDERWRDRDRQSRDREERGRYRERRYSSGSRDRNEKQGYFSDRNGYGKERTLDQRWGDRDRWRN